VHRLVRCRRRRLPADHLLTVLRLLRRSVLLSLTMLRLKHCPLPPRCRLGHWSGPPHLIVGAESRRLSPTERRVRILLRRPGLLEPQRDLWHTPRQRRHAR